MSENRCVEIVSRPDGDIHVRFADTGEQLRDLIALQLTTEADHPQPLPVLRLLAMDFSTGKVNDLPHGEIVNLVVTLPVKVEVMTTPYVYGQESEERAEIVSGFLAKWQ